nr:hypothetical protein [Tanacetum cinerariifolium]
GKFNGKADEGFLVGYSVSRSGPTWLFDIDTLTKSMNYQPVLTGNQPNPHAGIQEHFDTDKAGEGNVQEYVLFPLWSSVSKDPYNTDDDTTFEVKEPESEVYVSPSSSVKTKKHDDKTKREAKGKSPIELSTRIRNLSEEFEDFFDNSINEVNAASTQVPTVEKSLYVDPYQYPDDLDMPALEDITYSDDEEVVGVEANFSNLEKNITISPILKTRVHKDHYVTQIIGDLSSAPQTKSMTRMVKEQEPKRVHQALKDLSWIEAMQEELLQFKMQKVKQKKDGIFTSQDKYVANILRKFGLSKGKSASTLIDADKPLLKDSDGEDVDVHTYRSIIGSLMYLTSSRLDIMFAVCACA